MESTAFQEEHKARFENEHKELVNSMHHKLTQTPKLLSKSAGTKSCSIFRAPQRLVEINGECYRPQIVSIGPYHRGEPQLQMIEEQKWRYLKALLNRTQKTKGLKLEDYLIAVESMEIQARECYSENIAFESGEFIEMLVLDGCFIIELFRKVGKVIRFESDDPIVSMAYVLPFFYRDFLKLENQIPFFVLQLLFDFTISEEETGRSRSLLKLALNFFGNVNEYIVEVEKDLKGNHLLDLIRSSLIPETPQLRVVGSKLPPHVIHSVSKLQKAGIQFSQIKSNTFLDVKFREGTIEMPMIAIDDFMSSLLQNCVAFEQCYKGCSTHFTTYLTFLDCLINSPRDVAYLCDENVVENYLGTEGEVGHLINNMGKDIGFDIEKSYLSKLFDDVNKYYLNSWNVQWASFKYTYFSTPWSFISALAALILLILSIAQTIYTIYPFYHSP